MTNQPLLLHVGYHKTGSTWLQRVLFVGENGYHQVMDHMETFTGIVEPHGLHFDPTNVRELIEQRIAATPPGCVPVISSEILSGNPFLGGRESDVFAMRLKQIAPHARILLSIREQMAAITSVYLQYVRRGGRRTSEDFLLTPTEIGYTGFSPRHFEYQHLIGLYRDLFGAENVCVITQEALGEDPLAVGQRIADFADALAPQRVSGERVGASAPEYAVNVLRFVNNFRRGPMGNDPVINTGRVGQLAFRGVGRIWRNSPVRDLYREKKPVQKIVRKHFSGQFVESNRALNQLIGDSVDLSTYEGVRGS